MYFFNFFVFILQTYRAITDRYWYIMHKYSRISNILVQTSLTAVYKYFILFVI